MLHFRLSYCSPSLRSDIQRPHLILYFTCSTKVSPVFKLPCCSRITSVLYPLPLGLCAIASSSRRPFLTAVIVVVLALLDISATRSSRYGACSGSTRRERRRGL